MGSFLSSQLGDPNKPMAGATPFPGMLSAPPDQSLLASMNTMMGHGGYGGYAPRPFPTGALTGPGMPTVPWDYEGGKKKRKDDDPEKKRKRDDPAKTQGFNYDPSRLR